MKTLAALCYYSFVLTLAAALLQATWPLRREHVSVSETRSADLAGRPARNVSPNVTLRPLLDSYRGIPLTFETNQGQIDDHVKFLSQGGGYTVFLTQTSAVLVLRDSSTGKSSIAPRQTDLPQTAAHNSDSESRGMKFSKSSKATAVVRMELVGANPTAHAFGLADLPGKSNYFLGNDPKKWRTNIPTYAKIKYQNIYPGVDLVYHGSQGRLEYDFVVAPGCDPGVIAFELQGADKIRVDAQDDLVLQLGVGELRLRRPVIYQLVNGMRRSVSGSYVLRDRRFVSFRVEAHDPGKPLVVDPVVVYSTYLGGSSGGDFASGIAVDSSGNAYVTGQTPSTDFPTLSPFQGTLGGTSDAFVTKLNAAGSAVLYSTYLGGSGNDSGSAIAVDSSGNAYVTGSTTSSNFPTASPFQGTLRGTGSAFVTKLNAAGAGLLYSTYLGGSGNDSGRGIAVDSSGNAYVTGSTTSSNFPTASPFQGTLRGTGSAFVTKLNTAGAGLLYSTYLGGSGSDSGSGIAVDSSGNSYVTGSTTSSNFPTASPFQGTTGGAGDAFVTKLNAAGAGLLYSTYLGGSGNDSGSGIAVDSSGNAYVTGSTNSSNFPTAHPFQSNFGGGPSDAFAAKLSSSGSTLLYSTYLGGPERDAGTGIAVDSSGNAYLTGPGDSGSFPSVNPFQKTCGGCQRGGPDAFVAKIDPTQSGSGSLLYSSFLGGSAFDQGNGIAAAASGDVYVTGTAGSGFPITPGTVQTSLGGAFVTKISPNTAPGFTLTSASMAFGNQAFGTTSTPQSVILGNAGTATLTISSVAITGTNSGEFTQNNTCSTSVAGGANCSISVTFAPTTAGTKTAAITINDNAAGSPHILNLIGTGVPVSLSPSSLAFGNQLIGTTSAARVTTLTNIGSANLTITNLAITGTNSGDFAQSNNCPISPSTLAAGANCTISVMFKPTATFNRNATLTITDNGVGSPHTVPLSGTGTVAAFTISAAPSAATIMAGQSTTFTVTVAPGALTGGTVTLSCSGAPSAASCSLPASVMLNGTAVTATATITTTARSIMSPGPAPRNVSPRIGLRIGWQWLLLLVTLAMLVRPGRWPRVTFSAAMLLVILLAFGCGSGNGRNGGGGSSGTPAGTYLLTFTGTASPGVTNNTSVTLTVN